MMNKYSDEARKLNYDLTEERLKLELRSIDIAGDDTLIEDLMELLTLWKADERLRVLDSALALFAHIIDDSAFEGLTRLDVWGACLDTAMIWERG
jgi:hypothetical protein